MASQIESRPLGPDDVVEAGALAREALAGAAEFDWSELAQGLDWDCRRTLDHMADALAFYAGQLASRAQTRSPSVRAGDAKKSVGDLISVVGTMAHIVAAILRSVPPDARTFHPAGMADVSGYSAMACTELLLHTSDIAAGLGFAFHPPNELSARILARLFPWVADVRQPWEALRWATGRLALPDRPPVGDNWYWQCAPLDEWDGTVRTRPPRP